MNPLKSIKSRYSLANINSNLYQTITISGSSSGDTQGYIWVPYIPIQTSPIITGMSREWEIMILRAERIEKLEKLNKLNSD